eukprot:gene4690-9298_t
MILTLDKTFPKIHRHDSKEIGNSSGYSNIMIRDCMMNRWMSLIFLLGTLQVYGKLESIRLIRQLNTQSCVQFVMADNYGTGWGTAYLQIEAFQGDNVTAISYAPTSANNPATVKYCNSLENLVISSDIEGSLDQTLTPASTISASIVGKSDAYTGAILWKAVNLQTEDVLTGDYRTSMTLHLQLNDDISVISLENESSNLINDSEVDQTSCQSCSYATNYFSTASDESATPNSNAIVSSTSVISLYSSSSSTTVSSSRKLLNDIYLIGGTENTWFNSDDNGFSTTYEILDISRTTQYYSGQLCNDAQAGGSSCSVALPAGQYVWRVNGALSTSKDQIAWQYCGVHGGAATELVFTIDSSGKCVPDQWTSAASSSSDEISSDGSSNQAVYTLQGSFLATGITVQNISDSAIKILGSAIAMECMNSHNMIVMTDTNVFILSYESLHNLQYVTSENTEYTDTTKEFTFNIELSQTVYNTLKNDGETLNDVIQNIRTNLRNSMESGSFVSDVLQKSSNENEDSLQTLETVQLMKLNLLNQNNNFYEEDYVRVVDADFSILADGVVIAGLGFGIAFGVWMWTYMKRRSEQREFELDLSRSSVSLSTSLPRSLHGPDIIRHSSLSASAVPDVEQLQ